VLLDQEVNLVLDFGIEAVAIYSGVLSYEAVRIIRHNEELKSQRRIWMPVLMGGWSFAALGVILLVSAIASFLFPGFSFPTTPVVNVFLLLGLVLLAVATSRYLSLWSKYRDAKKAATKH
jgi:hypothetical protein